MTFLLLNQTFHPDVMATGQYLTDVALRLVERGHQVTVVTSRRAYDQPRTQFPKEEMWRGIRVYRVGTTGFGKGAKWRRAADFASFLALASLRLARLPRPEVVVALTSPPLISFLGAGLARLRRSRF
ncbi:MAG TPA: glycosyltransferase, partial [Verrucomicrobiota bacterium]|nr:glycosyltransferase [Verrucomicrobiota bacterium]